MTGYGVPPVRNSEKERAILARFGCNGFSMPTHTRRRVRRLLKKVYRRSVKVEMAVLKEYYA